MDAPSAHQSILSDTTQFGHAAALAGLALAKIAKAFLGGCHQGTILLRSDGRSPLAKGSSLKVADTCPKSRQLRDQRAPRQFGRSQRPSILGRRLRYVTAPAQRLQPVRIARVLARFALQRRNVITLQSSALTHSTQRQPSRSKTARRTAAQLRAFRWAWFRLKLSSATVDCTSDWK